MERLLAEHGASFDFAFIDADKRNYGIYYELALKLLRPGGTIVIDNTLLHGKVADLSVREKHVQAIRHLNSKMAADDRVNVSLLPEQ
ncbi:Omethyltransferase family protein [Acanthamoeba castellanii str. Neff]|uniref:Omethyltransferase family protein n=1 Tax=Acanthamoeba castellanii (strain ATCC 30010 / Neff) TaxID=1257118 RepID=L8HA91_ACACF|nr:Omethyltransferase family protein [Acanthamoeba castellanii str. Neff]ELR21613.1 Omethyltransferase family protein [Acanthamoeba castellanii str. Neff]